LDLQLPVQSVSITTKLDLQLPVQSVSVTTNVVSSNPAHGEVYSIQLYVIKFVSDLGQASDFHQVHWFSPQKKN